MANITKIYDIKLTGQGELVGQMNKVNKEFDDAKKKWQSLKTLISQGGLSSAEMAKYKLELQQTKLEMEKAKLTQQQLKNEGVSYTNALKMQREEERKNREEKKLSLDAYQKLAKELNENRKLLKAMDAENPLAHQSKEYQKQLQIVTELDKRLKAIDARAGQFQRNVGNYPGNNMLGSLNKNTIQSLNEGGLGGVVSAQINQTKNKVRELDTELETLRRRLNTVGTSGVGDLEAIERQIIENRNAASGLTREIDRIQAELRNTGTIGGQISNNLQNYFRNLKGELTGFVIGFLSFQTAFAKTQELIQNTYELADGITNVEIELGKATGGAQKLVDELGEIDTRTKLPELINIGNISIKAGVDESNLVGVVSAVDQIKTAFGKDFGEVETGTETFAKLINIFYEDREINGDRILKIGNSIRTLANETVASVPYINDFNGRMAGLRQTFKNFELSDSIGLGAGFEEFKQSAEVSSTALVKILPKLAADTAKFAKILGVPQAEFKKLINQNPAEALIQVSEKLVKSGKGVEEISASFADAELGAGRVTTILGTLGGKADVFRERIKRAGEAINDTTNITSAFNKKNENLSASMDKLKKSFVDAANNQNFQAFLKGVISLLSTLGGIVAGIPSWGWVTIITLLTLAYYENIKAIALNIAQTSIWIARTIVGNILINASTLLLRAQSVAIYLANAAWTVLNSTMLFLSGIFPALRTAWIALNLTMLATPIGWLIGGIAAIGGAMALMSFKTEKAAESIRKQGEAIKKTAAEMRVAQEITKRVNEMNAETISKMELLTRIVKDNSIALETRRKALQELININPKYLSGLTLENIKTAEGIKILQLYKDKLVEVAKAKANQQLLDEKQKKITENELKLNELNYESSKRYGKDVGALAQFVNAVVDLGKGYASKIGIGEGDVGLQIINLTEENKKLKQDRDVILKNIVEDVTSGKTDNFSGSGGGDGKPKKDNPSRGSRLTGNQKDYLKDLEANKNEKLAILKKEFLEGRILEDDFIQKSLAVNIDYHDKKIAYLKAGNAEERKQEAQAQLDKINDISEANDKLYNLYKKRHDDELQQAEDKARRKKDFVDSNPYSTEQEKLDAEKTYQEESTDAYVLYTQNMLDLQIKYSKNTIEETNKLLREQQKKIDDYNKANLNNPIQTREINLGIIDRTSDDIQNTIEIINALEKTDIIKNKNLTTEQKKLELERLSSKLELETTNATLARVIAKLTYLDSEIFAGKQLTQQEWERWNLLRKQKAELEQQKAELEEIAKWSKQSASVPSSGGLQNFIKNQALGKDGKISIGKDKDGNPVDGSELLGEIIAQSFDIATQAMNNYFEAERAAVERSKQVAYERIDLEKQQLLRTAQSAAERDSIEKQSAEKKKKADKEAGERLKKIKKQELKIALATQLANIGVAAAQNPLNGVTFGAAGIAMYSILAALAFAQYAMNLGALNNTQFAKGGIFRRIFARGGKLKGPSHSNGGMPIINPNTGQKVAEIEGEEGIINKNSMQDNNIYSVTGTPSQIASKINAIGGGVDWNGGATLERFMNGGTFLGSNLRPPVFRSYFENQQNSQNNNNNNSEEIAELKKMIADLAKMQKMESSKKVVLNPHDVSSYQNEYNKQTEIATL